MFEKISLPFWLILLLPCSANAAATMVTIMPHKAIYDMKMVSAKSRSNIRGVTGRMSFEWADACDGWAVQQHMQLQFNYAEGDESEVNSNVVTWESKDGSRYNFNIRRTIDGKEKETYRGYAVMEEGGGVGKYTLPKDKNDVILPSGTVFPSAHTILIITKALEGEEKLFTRRVFDGSDEEGQADVSVFIGERKDNLPIEDSGIKDNHFLTGPSWPVRLAFYNPTTETGEPDYEMDLILQSNGVARSMLIDYGDFLVSGVLSSVEAAPSHACGQ